MMDDNRINMENVYRSFFYAVLHDDIHELTNAAFSVLQCPIMVSDDIANNLSQSPDHYIGDKDWDNLIRTKSATSSLYYKFYKKYVKGSKYKEFPILINDGEAEKTTQLLSVLRKNGRFLGISAVLKKDKKEVTEDEREVISLFNTAAISIISKGYAAGIRSREMIMDYLTDAGGDPLRYPDMIKKISMAYKPSYNIVVGKLPKDSFDESIYKRVCSDISVCNQNIVANIYKDHIIIFCFGMADHNKDSTMGEIKERTGKFGICISISESFSDINDSRGYYVQALLTLKTGMYFEPKQNIYEYDEFALEDIAMGFSEHYPARLFIHPVLSRIIQYDKKNDSDYFESLQVYLRCMMNVKEAAKELVIHPNSMHYRIKRMAELFDIDFTDYDLINVLLMGVLLEPVCGNLDE
ncbi:MAG: helix-turn-helix domain-containing protein [Eubacteriaceae bacterium]|nr:helix-turn-helix domain-containing protein [Eubacteriaceae bacterium]